MLDELLRHSRLGTREELDFLIFRALASADRQSVREFKHYCTANHYSIGMTLEGALALLEFIGMLTISDGTLTVHGLDSERHGGASSVAYWERGDLVRRVLLAVQQEDALASFIPAEAIGRDTVNGGYFVRESLIPQRFLALRALMLSLGLFRRDASLGPTILRVSTQFVDSFEGTVIAALRRRRQGISKKMSLAQLKAQMQRQEQLGTEAELYVLDFEKDRLWQHPAASEIVRVSESAVGVGYDIESFESEQSIFPDRFIEVKSFVGQVSFYWSLSEVTAAETLEDAYYLYLVDRDQMASQGYRPIMLQNPYLMVYLNELWTRDCVKWKFDATPGLQGGAGRIQENI